MLRLGDRRIRAIKQALGMTESAFSHALSKLEGLGLVSTHKIGREKISGLTPRGRIVFASLQALCYTLSGTDGTVVEDDSALVNCLRASTGAVGQE